MNGENSANGEAYSELCRLYEQLIRLDELLKRLRFMNRTITEVL